MPEGVLLLFFKMPDCEHCASQAAAVEAFAGAHPEVTVRTIDLVTEGWPLTSVGPPEAVPAFLLLRPGKAPRTVQGRVLEREQLESWIAS